LPLAPGGGAAPSAGDGGKLRAGDVGRRILLVDDNRDAAESLGLLLEMMGHEVRVAHAGDEGLRALRTFDPAVVLLDIGMPDMDGYEVARRIREQEGSQRALLIAITGWGQDEDRQRAREAGFDHHLTKPVDLGELRKLVAGTAEMVRGPDRPP